MGALESVDLLTRPTPAPTTLHHPAITPLPGTCPPARWIIALCGQFLFVFSLVALSGPGRIDIVDGQTRFEVARSLVEHGDSIIRDRDVWMHVYVGRNGDSYTSYRFPQTA